MIGATGWRVAESRGEAHAPRRRGPVSRQAVRSLEEKAQAQGATYRPGGLFYLEQAEVDLDGRLHGNRMSVLHARTELPLLDGFDGLLIESQAQRTDYLHVPRLDLLVD